MSKRDQKKKARTGGDLSQFGIFAVPDTAGSDDESVGDDDLEAELMSIISLDKPATRPPRKKNVEPQPSKLDKMVADSLQDIPSDASLSGDEDDPSLLAELSIYTGETEEMIPDNKPLMPVKVEHTNYMAIITERISMYKEAEANANSIGDTSKARRIARGLKTLNELSRKVQAGLVINEEDIPLPISVGAKKPPEVLKPIDFEEPTKPEDAQQTPIDKPKENIESPEICLPETDEKVLNDKQKEALSALCARRDEYKKAALLAKRSGNMQTALAHVKLIKQFDEVIAAAEEGQPVDLSTMPPPPLDENLNTTSAGDKQPVIIHSQSPATREAPPIPEVAVQSSDEKNNDTPVTVLEALEARLNKFLEQEEAGKKDGNMSKARRMGRIVKQYQDAIKLHKAGKPIPVDELPTPPGFPPIPVETAAPKPSPAPSPVPSRAASTVQPVSPVSPSPATTPKPEVSSPPPQPPPRSMLPPTRLPKPQDVPSGSRTSGTRVEKQLIILRARQKQFKEAALSAKKNGNISLAKEYLRLSKCFDPLIEASLNGLPVDMSTLPTMPGSKENLEKEYEIIKISDCIPGTTSEIYIQLLSDLQKQLQMCMETRAHFKAIGDVGSANKFEQLAINTKKDLDTVKIACNKDDPVPRFHYEKRSFAIVRCNTDLNDNEFEISIIQGVNYNVPNPREIDTYVKFEFPFPTDSPYRERTPTVYNTNNPDYNSIYKIDIQRTNRSFQRIFKRHSIKFEIWSKGYFLSCLCGLCTDDESSGKRRGFFRGDSLLGTVSMKLQPLETKCTIHDSFDLMDGRRTVGGKLEIKARMRNPIATKQIEHLEEKWLVVD
ncbi:lethal (2) giant discs 1 isoform X2 [Rhodnius prolixus]|uniref:lethal (2) giant discs 1 isoform X2 n=1 Tax=Rhodnius prolixus TaxID=13249 RepID=UPI003D18D437